MRMTLSLESMKCRSLFTSERETKKIAWHDCVGQYLTDAGIPENLTANRDEWRAVINRLTSSKEGRRRR